MREDYDKDNNHIDKEKKKLLHGKSRQDTGMTVVANVVNHIPATT